jgi:hypothetical protein
LKKGLPKEKKIKSIRKKNESKFEGLTEKIKNENKEFEDMHFKKTMTELKELAKNNKIPGYTQMNKGELI